MYASVNTVRQLVMRKAAKEERGFISTTDFNQYAIAAQQELFQSILSQYRMYLANKQRYLTYYKESYKSLEAIHDDLRTLRRNRVTTTGDLPSDYAYYIDLETTEGRPIIVVDVNKRTFYNNAFDQAPSATYPIAIMGSSDIEIIPTVQDFKLSYYKMPQGSTTAGQPSANQPVWNSTNVSGNEVYNPSGSINFEFPKHLEYRLATIILSYVGIEMREADLYQMANNEEAKQKQDTNQ